MLIRTLSLVHRLGPLHAFRLLTAKACNRFLLPAPRLSWSQFGEDLVARDILGLEKGYYVDVGCNHPEKWSNTYLFYVHGWTGLLVDANQDLIAACRRRRRFDVAECCLLGDEEGEGEIAIYDEHALSSAVSDHNVERRGLARLLETRRIRKTTLTRLLERNHAPSDIDFLSIDVEGMDLMVLRGLDMTRYRPKLIAVEDAAFEPSRPADSSVVEFLVGEGYRLYSHVHPTLFFLAPGAVSKGFHDPATMPDPS